MNTYLVKRLGQAVFVLFGAHLVSFVLLYLLPSDAVAIKLAGATGQDSTTLSPADLLAAKQELGLDGTPLELYFRNLGHLLTGNFGVSFQYGVPVTDLIGPALASTLQLAGATIVLAVVGGLALGLAVGYSQKSRVRELLLGLPPLAVSIPVFAVGLVLIQIFAFQLKLLPSGGEKSPLSLILPSISLAIPLGAVIAQVFAKAMITSLEQPYIDTAFAKGASRSRLIGHAFVNSIGPVLALLGVLVGSLIGGAVVTETVFTRDGIGRMTVAAVESQDLPVVQAIVLLSALSFVIATLVVDLVYPLIDRRVARERPRLRRLARA